MNKNLKTVLHVSKSPCAGAPGNLDTCLNKYSYYNSKVYCQKPVISISNFSCDYQKNISPYFLQREIELSDLIHFHNCSPDDFYKYNFENVPFLIQLHSEPKTKVHILQKYRNLCITIAQKHATLYKSPIYLVPNIFDIYEERYLPDKKSKDKVVIFYSASSVCSHNDYTNTCAGKGYRETIKILNSIKKHYKDKVEIVTFLKEDKDIVLKAKRKVDIVIDECVTGGYHLTSLEALSMGCVTINNLNNKVTKVFRDISGYPDQFYTPFNACDINNLYKHLENLIHCKLNEPDLFISKQKNSRNFMENYWHPANMVKFYEKKYDDILNQNSNPYHNLRYSSNLNLVRKDRDKTKKIYDTSDNICLSSFYNIHKNKPALILASGPSVNRVNLTKHFKDDIIFSCNYFYKKFPELLPDYWCCIDSKVFREISNKIKNDTLLIANYPVKYNKIKNEIIWLTDNLHYYNDEFKSRIEIERPMTVATIMLLNAIYFACNPIYIIGVDLSVEKTESNYCYSDKQFNDKFRSFKNNYKWIIKDFKKLKHEAELKGIKVYNLDPEPENFNVFDKG